MSCAEMSELYNATRRVTGLRRNAAGDDDVMTPREQFLLATICVDALLVDIARVALLWLRIGLRYNIGSGCC
jgi:hypothetical protein